jgi:hypothetical protein
MLKRTRGAIISEEEEEEGEDEYGGRNRRDSNEVYGSRFYEGAPLGKVCRLAGLSREGENEVDWK